MTSSVSKARYSLQRAIRSTINDFGFDIVRVSHSIRPKSVGQFDYYKTRFGNYYLPSGARNDLVVREIRRGRLFEPEVVDVARRFARPGTAVLDVGANFGQMAVQFARMVGEKGRVYAIEAQRPVFEILEKNATANGADNIVSVFAAALAETGRQLRFPRPDFSRFPSFGSYNLPLDADEGDPVDSLKIDDLAIDRPVSFMKIDVQGCDLFAMQGAVETIARHRMPILFEFEQQFQDEYRTSFQDYVSFVASVGYEFTETVLGNNYLIQSRA
jgi:FkbM family methyltransferase